MADEKAAMELSAFQRDVLTEIMNVAAGRAAASLAGILRLHVRMSVIEIRSIHREELRSFLEDEIGEVGSMIEQDFTGGLMGNSLLVMTHDHAERLVQTLLHQNRALANLTSTEQTVLAEVGNIVLNAYISMFANQTGRRLHYSLPRVTLNLQGKKLAADILTVWSVLEGLVMKTHLIVGQTEVTLYMLILLMMDEQTIRTVIDEAINRRLEV